MLLPISDENYGRRTAPVINYLLIGINIFVFILEYMYGGQFINKYAAVPLEITSGAPFPHPVRVPGVGIIPPGPSPIYLTLLTSMFMHGGFLHIGGNMLFLWIFGDNVEDEFGHFKYLIFYLVCGFAASIAQIAIDPNSPIPSLGASGAIAGVLGSYIIMFPRNRVKTLVMIGIIFLAELPAVVVIGVWIILQFFNQFLAITNATEAAGGVAYMAHIGGFLTGLVLTFVFRSRNGRGNRSWQSRQQDRGYHDDWRN